MRVDAQQHLLDSHHLLLGSWGKQEELVEKSTRPKPLSASGDPGILLNNTMAGTSRAAGREDLASKLGKGRKQGHEANVKDRKNWAMEIYRGKAHEDGANLAKDEVLEFDLDEEEAEQAAKCLAIAIYYLRKSFSPQSLFSDMLAAWGIQNLNSLEKIGDYNFRLEFAKEEEKRWVIEGGPWRHKGDAMIVVHYDGLTRPSEVHIDHTGLWVRFYDLPPAMMKEAFAKQLGSHLGRFTSFDTR
jgi:hypothetical protein